MLTRSNTLQSKRSGFFGDCLNSTMHSTCAFYNRSHRHLPSIINKDKFIKSTNYDPLKETYQDRLKTFTRSKSYSVARSKRVGKVFQEQKSELSYFTLLRIVMIAFSMECLFCIQEALTVPLLLKLKVPEKLYSLVYLIIPLVGFFFQPVIGVLSDRCQSRFGPRRPFILVLSIASLMGLLLILNGSEIGSLLSNFNKNEPNGEYEQVYGVQIVGIIIACIGVAILNFSSDSSNNSCRALVIDNCNQEDQESGLNLMSFVSAIGSMSGYLLGAIQWSSIGFLKFLGSDMHIISIITTVIVTICLITTLTSIKETPLVLNEDDDEEDDEYDEESQLLGSSSNNVAYNSIDAHNLDCQIKKFNEYDESEEDDDQPITMGLLYKSVLNMPKELFRLLICHILGWMSIWSFCLFFTDFMAQSIYKGDPQSDPESVSFQLYNDGVQMGCWGLVCASIVSALYAVILEKYLLSYFSTKTLYFWSHLFYAVSIGLVYIQTNIYIIIVLSTTYGIVLNINMILPYQMISEFHQNEEYRNKSTSGTKRGIGIDCALLSSVFFLAQTLVASFTSLLTSTFGHAVIVLTSSFLAFLACFWIALFVIFPEDNDTENSSNLDQTDKISFTLTI